MEALNFTSSLRRSVARSVPKHKNWRRNSCKTHCCLASSR